MSCYSMRATHPPGQRRRRLGGKHRMTAFPCACQPRASLRRSGEGDAAEACRKSGDSRDVLHLDPIKEHLNVKIWLPAAAILRISSRVRASRPRGNLSTCRPPDYRLAGVDHWPKPLKIALVLISATWCGLCGVTHSRKMVNLRRPRARGHGRLTGHFICLVSRITAFRLPADLGHGTVGTVPI